MKPELPLATRESSQLDRRPQTTGDFIAAALASGVTPDSVAVVERLCALRERETQQQAERDFATDFVKLQGAMPPIEAAKAVPGNDGTIRFRYAPYEDIMRAVHPLLKEYGFAVTFDTEINEGRVTVTCTLMHVGGHTRSNKFAARIGQGPPKASEAQGDGAATTYAKRFALCGALNITVEQDTDARLVGDMITVEQANELEKAVRETAANEASFLKWCGAATYEDIPQNRLEEARAMLAKRKAKMTPAQPDPNKPGPTDLF